MDFDFTETAFRANELVNDTNDLRYSHVQICRDDADLRSFRSSQLISNQLNTFRMHLRFRNYLSLITNMLEMRMRSELCKVWLKVQKDLSVEELLCDIGESSCKTFVFV
jgi:hypothetical protein